MSTVKNLQLVGYGSTTLKSKDRTWSHPMNWSANAFNSFDVCVVQFWHGLAKFNFTNFPAFSSLLLLGLGHLGRLILHLSGARQTLAQPDCHEIMILQLSEALASVHLRKTKPFGLVQMFVWAKIAFRIMQDDHANRLKAMNFTKVLNI